MASGKEKDVHYRGIKGLLALASLCNEFTVDIRKLLEVCDKADLNPSIPDDIEKLRVKLLDDRNSKDIDNIFLPTESQVFNLFFGRSDHNDITVRYESEPLTGYDLLVMSAIYTLYKTGCIKTTYKRIYRYIGGNSSPNQEQRNKIRNSIRKLMSYQIDIDNRKSLIDIHGKGYGYKPLTKTGNLIDVKISNNPSDDDYSIVWIYDKPLIFEYCETLHNRIRAFPIEALFPPKSKIDENRSNIVVCLLRRIAISESINSNISTDTIRLSSLYQELQIDKPDDRLKRSRTRKYILNFLNHFRDTGIIRYYRATDTSIKFMTDKLQVKQDKIKQGKEAKTDD